MVSTLSRSIVGSRLRGLSSGLWEMTISVGERAFGWLSSRSAERTSILQPMFTFVRSSKRQVHAFHPG